MAALGNALGLPFIVTQFGAVAGGGVPANGVVTDALIQITDDAGTNVTTD